MSAAAAEPLESLAAEVGARDVFVLRRVEDGRYVHLGGTGRGEGWAGIVALHLHAEPYAERAVESGAVVRVRASDPVRVFGPYWSTDAAFVPVDHDRLVVLGGDVDVAPDAALRDVSARAAGAVDTVSPAKRLADELEVMHAVKAVLGVEAGGLEETARAVTDVITGALSCELGVLWLRDGDHVTIVERGFPAPGGESLLGAAVAALLQRGLPECEQDARVNPLPAPLDVPGITSWYALAIGPGAEHGVLVACHTERQPRGFTLLCQELGQRAADAAASVLHTAVLRDRLQDDAARSFREARRDRLTGLGNRLAWDEAAGVAPEPLSVIFADLDNLKAVNDSSGHHAGDALLRAFADVMRACVREGDVVCRLGGDEFAVLLPAADGRAVRAVAERVEVMLADHRPVVDGHRPEATLGMATAPPQGGAEGALRSADAIVRAAKQERRRGRAA